jgi:choline dehydrogenase-like flavoprotein
MIIDGTSIEPETTLTGDLVVVGAGPAGIVVALELATQGFDVLLIESGGESFSREAQELSDAAELNPDLHAPMSIATRRQVGGASVIWGGRCVPYDPVDLDFRPHISDARWPVSYDELTPHFQRACYWLVCGRPVFDAALTDDLLPRSIVPGFPDGEVRTSSLERWSLPTDFGKEYRRRLRDSPRIRLVTGLTCTEVSCDPDGSRIDHLKCKTLAGKAVSAQANHYVLACGGLDTTRLLLASPRPNGEPIGNHSDHLGRWYMGHVEGVVANIHFSTPPQETVYDYVKDIDGVYVRHRISLTREFQHEHGLPNVVAWLANPELADPRHRSGALSFAYLVLASPLGHLFSPDAQRLSLTGNKVPGAPYGPVADNGSIRDHLLNLLRHPAATARFVVGFGGKRLGRRRRRMPGFFIGSPINTYPLQYHGEHIPHRESRVTLGDDRDSLGMPRLRIDLRFSEEDAEGVVRAHRHWDEYLRRTGFGRLEPLYEDLKEAVQARIGGGFHQIGTTRMSARPEDGVVDRNLAVHGISNLYVVSSSTFVTSGQANSTFMIIVFAVRLAEHLRALLRQP